MTELSRGHMWSKNSEPNFCPHDVDVDD